MRDATFSPYRAATCCGVWLVMMIVCLPCRYTEPADSNRALYDLVPCDSKTEQDFVRELEQREDVKYYLKLPRWFVIRTPLGEHDPDWAVVLQDEEGAARLHLVAKTRGSLDPRERRGVENLKLHCAARHLAAGRRRPKGRWLGSTIRS